MRYHSFNFVFDKKIWFIVTTFIFLSSCQSSDSQIHLLREFENALKIHDNPSFSKDTRAYIIIPNTGCEGCITAAEQLLKDLIDKKYPVNFILTNITSFKTLRLKLGHSVINDKRVYVDMGNKFYNNMNSVNKMYPAIFYCEHNSFPFQYEYIEPNNPEALEHLNNYLSNLKN